MGTATYIPIVFYFQCGSSNILKFVLNEIMCPLDDIEMLAKRRFGSFLTVTVILKLSKQWYLLGIQSEEDHLSFLGKI
jgi:hypothetical protein